MASCPVRPRKQVVWIAMVTLSPSSSIVSDSRNIQASYRYSFLIAVESGSKKMRARALPFRTSGLSLKVFQLSSMGVSLTRRRKGSLNLQVWVLKLRSSSISWGSQTPLISKLSLRILSMLSLDQYLIRIGPLAILPLERGGPLIRRYSIKRRSKVAASSTLLRIIKWSKVSSLAT